MVDLIHDFIGRQAIRRPDSPALLHRKQALSYQKLWAQICGFSRGIHDLGLVRQERVAIFLPKRFEAVVSFFGAAAAGAVFVPINPLLKPKQVAYILRDCNVRVLVTSAERADLLAPELESLPDLRFLVVADGRETDQTPPRTVQILPWGSVLGDGDGAPRVIDADMAAILYTSGSTGKPKGVVLTHRNLVAGARSVAGYLENRAEDRILAVLPFSFDYGLSQLTTAFVVGAQVTLMEYLFPKDVIRTVAREGITGLAAVPPMWIELARHEWPQESSESLRYVTNSGGSIPQPVLAALREHLPQTKFFLMYGLTEAFRSTYLDPSEIDRRPESIGKAIPNSEIMVVREDGSCCEPNEPGELVHRGALVSLGYWNDPDNTAARFRVAPGGVAEVPIPEIALWSGDTVRTDEDGFLYFVGRRDEMIKTSGYRVSPTEVEEVLYAGDGVAEAVALGLPHPALGQGIVAVVTAADDTLSREFLIEHCQRCLPNFMVPREVVIRTTLPRNPNGKIDRKALAAELEDLFQSESP